jgi:hypothetical protein
MRTVLPEVVVTTLTLPDLELKRAVVTRERVADPDFFSEYVPILVLPT